MSKRVRRGSKIGSRLKKLRLDKVMPASELGHFQPIGEIGDDDGLAERTSRSKKRGGERVGAARVKPGSDARFNAEEPDDVALAIAVSAKGGSDFAEPHGGDAFERARDAYEAYLKGNVKQDAERFKQLVAGGARDDFDPSLSPAQAEQLGHIRSAKHLVRLYDNWTLDDVGRTEAIDRAATWLAGFIRPENVKKVLLELEGTPIRDIYPLEVMLHLMETHPHKLRDVKGGSVVGNFPALTDGSVFAGHAIQVPVPQDMRLKSFALLGGERPGYEFFPSTRDGHYQLQIDTPGAWELALFAVRVENLGKMARELPGGVVEKFTVNVAEMGRKQ